MEFLTESGVDLIPASHMAFYDPHLERVIGTLQSPTKKWMCISIPISKLKRHDGDLTAKFPAHDLQFRINENVIRTHQTTDVTFGFTPLSKAS
jgi:hypothetical protein